MYLKTQRIFLFFNYNMFPLSVKLLFAFCRERNWRLVFLQLKDKERQVIKDKFKVRISLDATHPNTCPHSSGYINPPCGGSRVWSERPSVSQGFNDGLDELCKTQKGWAIPDKEQRDFIRRAQRRVVSDTYRAFLQRWDALNAHGFIRSFHILHALKEVSQIYSGNCHLPRVCQIIN